MAATKIVSQPNSMLMPKLLEARNYQVSNRIIQDENNTYSSDMDIDNVTRLRHSELIENFDNRLSEN